MSNEPRYRDQQDSREIGLSLLRAQYERAGNPHLTWNHQLVRDNRKVQIFNSCGVKVTLEGEPEKITALATLISRAVNLGWFMLNELEPPVPADGAGGSRSDTPEAK